MSPSPSPASIPSPNFAALWLPRLFGFVALGVLLFGGQSLVAAHPYLGHLAGRDVYFNEYYEDILIMAGVSIILAVSLNLINGICGQFSLGHAGFMAIGAYSSAYFTKMIGFRMIDPLNFGAGILVAAVTAGIAGLVVGLPSLRLRGDYLAIVTLGFNKIIISIIYNIKAVGGASGFTDISKFTNFAWTFGLVFACILSIRNLADSDLGRSMRAIRDDEIAAEASGINTTRVKVLAFVISAMWAGIAGALYVHYIQLANPKDFNFLKSVEIVVMVVLGGLGSITGSAISAVGLQIAQEILREPIGVFWTGLVFLIVATYWNLPRHRAAMKRGIAGWLGWLATPAFFLLILLGIRYFSGVTAFLNGHFASIHLDPTWLETNKGSLRYLMYSLLLIVIMLVRPQGLLGRNEWSFRRWRLPKRRPAVSET